MTITWDSSNEQSHYQKHKIHFNEAITVYDDPCSIVAVDKRHGELRFTIIGLSESGNLLRVTYAFDSVDEIRIISARRASPANRKEYFNRI